MKILLPMKIAATGGTSTFGKKFKQAAHLHGHEVTFVPEDHYDILVVPATCPLTILRHAQRRGVPIVHRLDGVYYPSTTVGWRYPLHNFPMQFIRRRYADSSIYQSYYAKHCCEIFLGPPRSKKETIIYNGVDTAHFSPGLPHNHLRDNARQHIFINWSRFRAVDQVLPLIRAIMHYRQKYTMNAKLVLAGNFSGRVARVPRAIRQLSYVQWLGVIPNDQLVTTARGADVFLFTHHNTSCPNNVLEAMACGLPICGVADGAVPELVAHEQTGLLIPAHGEAWYTQRKLDLDSFVDNMHHLIDNKNTYGQEAVARVQKLFSLDQMVRHYLNWLASAVAHKKFQ